MSRPPCGWSTGSLTKSNAATSWSSCPRSRTSARPATCSRDATAGTSGSCPCMRDSPRRSSAGSLSPSRNARSSWPRTSPRRPSRSPASASSSTRDWPASPITTPGRGPRGFPSGPSPEAAPTSGRAAAAAWSTACASGSSPARTTRAGPFTRPPRSCAPTWPRSFSGCLPCGSTTPRCSPSWTRPRRRASAAVTTSSRSSAPSSARRTETAPPAGASPNGAAGWLACRWTPGSPG